MICPKVKGVMRMNFLKQPRRELMTFPNMHNIFFEKAHDSAIREYKNPDKRRGGKKQSAEEVAHNVAWSAVKKNIRKRMTNGSRKIDDSYGKVFHRPRQR